MTFKQRSSLGRNLSALLSQSTLLADDIKVNEANFIHLAMQCLQPSQYQPRRDFNEASLAELAASIKQQGILQPLVVRKMDPEHYEILAGERRWRAAQLAGLTDIPVMVKQVNDETAMAIALIENLQREDLSALDQANAMQRLVTECDLTHQQVADLLGKSRAAVSNYLRLLSLSAEVKYLLDNKELDMGHARALLALPHEQQAQIATLIVAKGLSVRETEQLIQRLNNKTTDALTNQSETTQAIDKKLFRDEAKRLTQELQTRVRIKQNQAGKGTVIIHFDSQDDLEKIIGRIR